MDPDQGKLRQQVDLGLNLSSKRTRKHKFLENEPRGSLDCADAVGDCLLKIANKLMQYICQAYYHI